MKWHFDEKTEISKLYICNIRTYTCIKIHLDHTNIAVCIRISTWPKYTGREWYPKKWTLMFNCSFSDKGPLEEISTYFQYIHHNVDMI